MVATLQGTQAQTGSCRALFQKECVHWYPWTGLDNTCLPSCQACLKWNISNCRKCLANCIENLTALKSAKLQKLVGLTVCTVLWNALVLTHRHYKRTCFFAFFLFARVLATGTGPRSGVRTTRGPSGPNVLCYWVRASGIRLVSVSGKLLAFWPLLGKHVH